jgi:GT2 family glycosyltransferase
VVVDNHSDKENVEALKKFVSEFQNVEPILNKYNVGYFEGLNIGIRYLRASQKERL